LGEEGIEYRGIAILRESSASTMRAFLLMGTVSIQDTKKRVTRAGAIVSMIVHASVMTAAERFQLSDHLVERESRSWLRTSH